MIPSSAAGHPTRAFHPFDPRRATLRGLLAALAALATVAALPTALGVPLRLVAGWDACAVTLLSLAWIIIGRSDAAETQHRAAMVDPGRTTLWALVIASSTVSLFAATVVLRQARRVAPGAEAALVALCLLAVAAAWLLTHTACTLRYAHLYYREDEEGIGGLEFPGGRAPDYLDFAYFGLTIGMCFQVSDVTITGRSLRRAVTGHAVLSFAYNTAVLALAMNLFTGLLG
jgi:uncharacterized membrane protein